MNCEVLRRFANSRVISMLIFLIHKTLRTTSSRTPNR